MKEVIVCHKINISIEPMPRGVQLSQESEFPASSLKAVFPTIKIHTIFFGGKSLSLTPSERLDYNCV